MSDEKPEGVGYGKPPADGQFKKGQSGRRKRTETGESQSFAALIDRMLDRKMRFKFEGKWTTGTMRELIVQQQVINAVKGDLEALDLIVRLDRHAQKHGKGRDYIVRIEGRDF